MERGFYAFVVFLARLYLSVTTLASYPLFFARALYRLPASIRNFTSTIEQSLMDALGEIVVLSQTPLPQLAREISAILPAYENNYD